jgi:hypothetical protein
MAKKSKNAEIEKQKKALLSLILKKAGVSYKDLITHAEQEYIVNNIDLITPAEAKKFPNLVL